MRSKKYVFIISFFILLSGLSTSLCYSKQSNVNQELDDNEILINLDELAPNTVIKVDPYPLFVLKWDGDYGFKEYLKTGVLPDHSFDYKAAPDLIKWGCACFTAFGDKDNIYFGRNFDWANECALILYTDSPEAHASVSIIDPAYSGYTDNMTSRELQISSRLKNAPFVTCDGMNEKGVSIAFLAVPHAEPPYNPKKVALNAMQTVRYILDYANDFEHAISLIKVANFQVESVPEHFIIADASGKSAIVEYIDNEIIIIYNNESFQVATNFIITGSGVPEVFPCNRYKTAYNSLKAVNGKIDSNQAMNILQSISQSRGRSKTIWSAVYNLSDLTLKIATGRNYFKIFKLGMN